MGKGKTGGHWRPCNVGSVEAHNERQKDYLESVKKAGLNLYFFPQLSNNNSHWVSSHERYNGKTVAEVFEEMKKLYQQKTGQPPQLGEKTKKSKKTGREYKCAGWSPIREMCVPIRADTQIEDFDFLRRWATKYGIEIMRIDLHKDEGYYDPETGEYKMNYHAHVVASFMDWETGKTVKAGREAMSEMQTILAISLCMERGERKADTGKKYLTHQEYRVMKEELDEKKKLIQQADEKLNHVNGELKKAETKLKGLSTMLHNLEQQREAIEIDIAALQEMREKGEGDIQEINNRIGEKQRQLSAVNFKLEDKQQKLITAEQQLQEVTAKKKEVENKIKILADDAIQRHDNMNEKLKEAELAIRNKRKEIAKMDKTGELSQAQKHIEDRDAIIYRRWPEARNAIEAIHQLGSTPSARDFTPQQALHIEHALVTSGIDRIDAAKDLLSLAQKDFENNRTWPGWVENTGREVMRIANGTHQRLTALLKQQPKDAGGGPSYITDLTDWAGNQIKV